MPKIAIITLDAEKDEHLVAWVNNDMTITAFCWDCVMVLEDAKKCAGAHLVNTPVWVKEATLLNYPVTVDRKALYWDNSLEGTTGVNCRPGTKVWPMEKPPETAHGEARPKIAIITLDTEKDEYLVAWVNSDMTIKSFCGDHVMVLQDAKTCANSHLAHDMTDIKETASLKYPVTMDRDVLYWSHEVAIKCPAGTKVWPMEKPPETAQPELTYSEVLPNQEGWYWMRAASGFESVKRIFIHSNEELCTWVVNPTGENTIMPVGWFKDVQWAGPIAKPGGIKHA